MSRKLATIQKIKNIRDIPGADNIQVGDILGWKVVIKKDQFKHEDLVVYCEIDSILPDKPEFSFLKERNFRIKTARLRGQISQGICFPLSILPENVEIEEGLEVTDVLEITQHIPQIPANISGEVKGYFPSFLVKTDETRVQVLQDVLKRHEGLNCVISEKLDGCSVTYYLRDGEFGVCSRNLELKETEGNLLWKLARKMKLEEKMRKINCNLCLQGECVGPGIQKNVLKLPENEVFFFNAFDIDKFKYLDMPEFINIINLLDLKRVPIVEEDYILESDIDWLVEKSKGFSKLNPKVFREGIVIRPFKEMFDLQMAQGFGNGRLSFKVINPEYLLKYEE